MREYKFSGGRKAVIILWLSGILVNLLLFGGIVYAAVHFIRKLW